MSRDNPSPNLGGARPGAGRPRTLLRLQLPPAVYHQFQAVAVAESATIEDVVREALLDWLERWQSAHDADSPA